MPTQSQYQIRYIREFGGRLLTNNIAEEDGSRMVIVTQDWFYLAAFHQRICKLLWQHVLSTPRPITQQ